MFDFYEFFAGGGMARAGLGAKWRCVFANDFDRKKAHFYERNWGVGVLTIGDVRKVTSYDLPGTPHLVWGSFPCQDLSLAGGGAGLRGDRSGTFWPFWELMRTIIDEERRPPLIVLENVPGTLNSHGGKDFATICESYQLAGYNFGAMIIDAAHFVPQSRPRLFVIGVRNDIAIPEIINAQKPNSLWHTARLQLAYKGLSKKLMQSWIWWDMPMPPKRNTIFADLIEENPTGVEWHSAAETRRLLAMMSPVNLAKVEKAKHSGRRQVGAIYRRTRVDRNGTKVQRAEVRFDEVAGCLRTPAGGSSRQIIMVVERSQVRSRLISTRETARLMGLPDDYILPDRYNEAYHLTGDGVVVPVVSYLAEQIFEPILATLKDKQRQAA